jgi:hypothetical protein
VRVNVEKQTHSKRLGFGEEYNQVDYTFDFGERIYRASQRLGSGVEIKAPSDPHDDELAAVADYLMAEAGIRHVYYEDRPLRPPPLQEPRPLRPDERLLLDHLLAVDDPRVAPLRAQAEHVYVAEDARLPLDLEFGISARVVPPAVPLVRGPVIQAHTIREGADMLTVELWLKEGYLHSIEVDWYDDEPARLPRPYELRPAELR